MWLLIPMVIITFYIKTLITFEQGDDNLSEFSAFLLGLTVTFLEVSPFSLSLWIISGVFLLFRAIIRFERKLALDSAEKLWQSSMFWDVSENQIPYFRHVAKYGPQKEVPSDPLYLSIHQEGVTVYKYNKALQNPLETYLYFLGLVGV